jgi:hypothetical protein
LATVTETFGARLVLPAASRTRADSVCPPFATAALFQVTEYGAVVDSTPSGVPSSRNCTPTTPMLSVAFAVTGTSPDTVAAAPGAVIVTVGAAASRAVTVSKFAPDCRTMPLAVQLVVPVAVPLPPRLLAHVTCVTPTDAVPAKVKAELAVL